MALAAVAVALLRSRAGLWLMAIRDSEPGAQAVGIETTRTKRRIYLFAAAIAGAAGALIYITQINVRPDAAFSINWAAYVIFIVVIGGIGTIEGPIVGTLIFLALSEALSALVGVGCSRLPGPVIPIRPSPSGGSGRCAGLGYASRQRHRGVFSGRPIGADPVAASGSLLSPPARRRIWRRWLSINAGRIDRKRGRRKPPPNLQGCISTDFDG